MILERSCFLVTSVKYCKEKLTNSKHKKAPQINFPTMKEKYINKKMCSITTEDVVDYKLGSRYDRCITITR